MTGLTLVVRYYIVQDGLSRCAVFSNYLWGCPSARKPVSNSRGVIIVREKCNESTDCDGSVSWRTVIPLSMTDSGEEIIGKLLNSRAPCERSAFVLGAFALDNQNQAREGFRKPVRRRRPHVDCKVREVILLCSSGRTVNIFWVANSVFSMVFHTPATAPSGLRLCRFLMSCSIPAKE